MSDQYTEEGYVYLNSNVVNESNMISSNDTNYTNDTNDTSDKLVKHKDNCIGGANELFNVLESDIGFDEKLNILERKEFCTYTGCFVQPDAIIEYLIDDDLTDEDALRFTLTLVKVFGTVIPCHESSWCDKKYVTVFDVWCDDYSFEIFENSEVIRYIMKKALLKSGIKPYKECSKEYKDMIKYCDPLEGVDVKK